LTADVKALRDIRNRDAHSGLATTRSSVNNARKLVFKVLSAGAEIEAHPRQHLGI